MSQTQWSRRSTGKICQKNRPVGKNTLKFQSHWVIALWFYPQWKFKENVALDNHPHWIFELETIDFDRNFHPLWGKKFQQGTETGMYESLQSFACIAKYWWLKTSDYFSNLSILTINGMSLLSFSDILTLSTCKEFFCQDIWIDLRWLNLYTDGMWNLSSFINI